MNAASADNAPTIQNNAAAGPSSRPNLFLPPPGPPPSQPVYLSSTQDLLSKFQLLPAYDKYVRPKNKPGSGGAGATAGGDSATSPVVDKGKGKEVIVGVAPTGQGGGQGTQEDGDDEEESKKKKNSYKHLIKALPGKHSMRKDDYLQMMIQIPPKERISIEPFDARTQRDAFTVGLDGLKGWNSSVLVQESAQAREDRKRRKELKRLARQAQLQAHAQAQAQGATGASASPTVSMPSAGATLHAPAPRAATPHATNPTTTNGSKSSTPRPSIPRPGSAARPAPAPTISISTANANITPGTPIRAGGPSTPTVPHPLRTSTPASAISVTHHQPPQQQQLQMQQPTQQQPPPRAAAATKPPPPPHAAASLPSRPPLPHSISSTHLNNTGVTDMTDKRGVKRGREENGSGPGGPPPPGAMNHQQRQQQYQHQQQQHQTNGINAARAGLPPRPGTVSNNSNGNGNATNASSNGSNVPSQQVPKAIIDAKAGVDGVRPRPVKKRKDLQGHARDVTAAPVQQQPTPQGV